MCTFFNVHFPYSQIYCEVIPKRHALSQANAELETATAKMLAVQKKLMVSAMLLLYLIRSKSYISKDLNGFLWFVSLGS